MKYTENLKPDIHQGVDTESKTTDLLLVLGTSLSGMNADKLAEKVSGRAIQKNALGIVIINLQQTRLDKSSSLRIWSKLGDTFQILSKLLNLDEIEDPVWKPKLDFDNVHIFDIPYDDKGKLSAELHKLNLSIGASLMIVDPNAPNYGASLTVLEKDKSGDWVLQEHARSENDINKRRRLHRWWIDVAQRGRLLQFPLCNIQNPVSE